jgi:hypothetical protein
VTEFLFFCYCTGSEAGGFIGLYTFVREDIPVGFDTVTFINFGLF